MMSIAPDAATMLMLRSQMDKGRLYDMRAACRGSSLCHS